MHACREIVLTTKIGSWNNQLIQDYSSTYLWQSDFKPLCNSQYLSLPLSHLPTNHCLVRPSLSLIFANYLPLSFQSHFLLQTFREGKKNPPFTTFWPQETLISHEIHKLPKYPFVISCVFFLNLSSIREGRILWFSN